jgi:hypothetical protein
MFPRLLILAVLLSGTALAPGARAQDAETFTHWKAECADALCVAQTVTPGGVVSLRILRENAPDAPWEIAFAGMQDDLKEGTPIEVSVDGSRPMRFSPDGYTDDGERIVLTDQKFGTALFATLVRGDKATLAFTHNSNVKLRLNFSLAGLGAAIRWIEENQGRNQDTAQSQPSGPPEGAPDHVPAAPEGPADSAQAPETPPPASEPAQSREPAESREPAPQAESRPPAEPAEVPDPVASRHTQDEVCKDYDAEHLQSSRVADKLDDHHTLYLLPCYTGAYNVIYRVWITDSRSPDEVERSLFAGYTDEQGWYGTDQLINADYNPETKTLTAFEKGRGLGDCGAVPTYQWHAGNWRMMEYRYWGKCDGSRQAEDWPVVFEHPEK